MSLVRALLVGQQVHQKHHELQKNGEYVFFFVLVSPISSFSFFFFFSQETFRSVPTGDGIASRMNEYTAYSSMAGTLGGQKLIDVTVNHFGEFVGIDNVAVHEYEVLLSYPLTRNVTMISPTVYSAGLAEAKIPEDPTSIRNDVVDTCIFLIFLRLVCVSLIVIY